MTDTAAPINIRDRVKELKRVRAGDLKPHPKHFHTHSPDQRSMMRGVLEEIGYVDALVGRILADGSIECLDGHMRREETPDLVVPVLIVELDDDEADKVLATFDPIGNLASVDAKKQTELLASIDATHAETRRLLADIEQTTLKQAIREEGNTEDSELDPVPDMALRQHEHYDFIVVMARTTQEWNALCDRLGLVAPKRIGRGKMGVARGIPAAKLLELLADVDAKRLEKTPEAAPIADGNGGGI